MSRITNVNVVFASGKAIKSTATDDVTTWFYRNDDREYVAYHESAGRQFVDRDTVERNIYHDHTTIETVDVDESPFGK